MQRAGRLASFLAIVALVFGGVTLFALEGGSVATLHTKGPDGKMRKTHVWFAEDAGAIWIEAATADRPFYTDIASRPIVLMELWTSPLDWAAELVRGRAVLMPEPEGHRHIREMLREKYGWADVWIGLLTDTSQSRAIRIATMARLHPGDEEQ